VSRHSGIESAAIAPNPGTVLPILLLVDVSNSMNSPVLVGSSNGDGGTAQRADGTRLVHLLRALDRLPDELEHIGVARRGGEIAMITFGGNGVNKIDLQPDANRPSLPPTFVKLESVRWPKDLSAGGHTPLGEALDVAVRIVRRRNNELAQLPHYRAQVWLITDGQNTDVESGFSAEIAQSTIDAVRQLENDGLALLFTAMLPGAVEALVRRITPESAYPVAAANFERITQLIAGSSQSVTDPTSPANAIYRRLNEVLG
jgi:uncharacterized protein YegL